MDISRDEQRVLHVLAQGGYIVPLKDSRGKIITIDCLSREGWRLNECNLVLFKKLKRKKAIKSVQSKPYRITQRGLVLVRSEFDNR